MPTIQASQQGKGAPLGVHPHFIHKEGQKAPHGQRVPYSSKDKFEDREEYIRLVKIFDNVFECILANVSLDLICLCPFFNLILNRCVTTFQQRQKRYQCLSIICLSVNTLA